MKLYSVQAKRGEEWVTIVKDGSRAFCEGYAMGRKDCPGISLALRVVTSAGKVVEEYRGRGDAPLGMIAGFPTPEQYEAAAAQAMRQAEAVRERQARKGAR